MTVFLVSTIISNPGCGQLLLDEIYKLFYEDEQLRPGALSIKIFERDDWMEDTGVPGEFATSDERPRRGSEVGAKKEGGRSSLLIITEWPDEESIYTHWESPEIAAYSASVTNLISVKEMTLGSYRSVLNDAADSGS